MEKEVISNKTSPEELRMDLYLMIIESNMKEGNEIVRILDKYGPYGGLVTLIPDEKIPEVIDEIKKTLKKGCS